MIFITYLLLNAKFYIIFINLYTIFADISIILCASLRRCFIYFSIENMSSNVMYGRTDLITYFLNVVIMHEISILYT